MNQEPSIDFRIIFLIGQSNLEYGIEYFYLSYPELKKSFLFKNFTLDPL